MTGQSCLFYEKIGDFWQENADYFDKAKEAAYKSERLWQKLWVLQPHNIRYECKTLC